MSASEGSRALVGTLDLYKSESHYYDTVYFDRERYLNEINFLNEYIKNLGLGKRILDVGCGTGSHIKILNEMGFDASGLDLSSEMIAFAQKKCPELKFSRGDMRCFELGASFDIITCMYGAINYLELIDEIRATLENFYRHLVDGGVVLIDTRWSKNLPDKAYIAYKGDSIIIRRWVAGKGTRDSDLYICTMVDQNSGHYFTEVHNLFFQNPFLIKKLLEKAGFTEVRIFERYDISRPFFSDTDEHEAVLVAQKRL